MEERRVTTKIILGWMYIYEYIHVSCTLHNDAVSSAEVVLIDLDVAVMIW